MDYHTAVWCWRAHAYYQLFRKTSMHARGILRGTPGRQSTVLRSTARSLDCGGGRTLNLRHRHVLGTVGFCSPDPQSTFGRSRNRLLLSSSSPTPAKFCWARQGSSTLQHRSPRFKRMNPTMSSVMQSPLRVLMTFHPVSTSFPTITETHFYPPCPKLPDQVILHHNLEARVKKTCSPGSSAAPRKSWRSWARCMVQFRRSHLFRTTMNHGRS